MGHQGRPRLLAKALDQVEDPRGRSASFRISASFVAVKGLHSAGFRTTVFPKAKAGAMRQVESIRGAFQGVMIPTGPAGTRTV